MAFNSLFAQNKQVFKLQVLKGFLLILLLTAGKVELRAQESMLPELSYPYLEKLIFAAKQNYPRMKANQHRVSIAELNLRRTKMSWLDFFTLSAFYSPSTSVTLTNATLTGVQVGLFINFAQIIQKPTAIKLGKEEVTLARLQYDEYALTIEAQVKDRYFRYIQQLTTLRMRTQTALDADLVFKQVKYKFERGEDTFENYSKAMTQNADMKQRVIDSEGQILIAKSSLEELVGKKLEEIK
ncbi:MAG: TolC family protein [Sediminibacterium sp.]|nr:TolC family protein [Sediminibacterium sp.]